MVNMKDKSKVQYSFPAAPAGYKPMRESPSLNTTRDTSVDFLERFSTGRASMSSISMSDVSLGLEDPETLRRTSLSPCEASLALLSAIVGGGIVAIPFAIIHTGIPIGVALNVGMALTCLYSGYLLLCAKQMSPTYVESFYELGFLTMGKWSIYFISITILISLFGCMMIYFIIFGDITASLVKQLVFPYDENVFTTRTIYVLTLGFLMIPFIIQKKLAELKCVSILLFTAIFTFIGLFIVQLFRLGNIENHDEQYGQYYEIKFDLKLVTAMNITTTAYAYQVSLFPTYNSLGENRSNKNALKTVIIGLSMTFTIYVSLAILSIYIFGSELHASVLENVDEQDNTYSIIIRVAF
jgi:amino acid permease